MELQQEIVEDIEKLIIDYKNIRKLAAGIEEYFKEPRTKLEIMEYSKINILGEIFKEDNFKSIYPFLINKPSIFNNNKVIDKMQASTFVIGSEWGKCYSDVIRKTLELMKQVGDKIQELTYDDVVERGIALRRSYLRLIIVLGTDLPVVINDSDFPSLSIEPYESTISYMTETIDSLEEGVINRNDGYNSDFKSLNDWVLQPGFIKVQETNLVSLMNFVIYLGSLVRY